MQTTPSTAPNTKNSTHTPRLAVPSIPLDQTSPKLACVPADRLLFNRTSELVNVLSVLSPGEQKELAECELIIARQWETFVQVGRALATIRDKRLYRAYYDSFEVYCREKWQYGRSHAYRLIGAAEVVSHLSPIGDIPAPTHEAQVRPLIGLEPEKVRLVWRQAVAKAVGVPVTARLVKQVASGVARPEGKSPAKPQPLRLQPRVLEDRIAEACRMVEQVEQTIREHGSPKTVLRLLERLRNCLKSLHNCNPHC